MALTLRLLGGLTTDEIARAFLVPEPTVAQRIVRAKRTLSEARVPFEVPRGAELSARLASVLEVIYLVFNEGYVATAGDDLMRPELCEEALRLGRILAELAPKEPEVHGLVALMEIQASRSRRARRASGEPVLLLDQDRARWDRVLIGRGLAALERAERLVAAKTGRTSSRPRSPPVMPAPARPRRPTGRRSRLSTRSSHGVMPRLSCSSTGPSRSAWRRARPRPRARRFSDRRALARGIPSPSERAGRSALQARTFRRGPRRVRTRGDADPERARNKNY